MAEEARDLRKRENTRARLLEAGADVLVAKGFEGARIDDVVKAAGFTRGAFYSNYSSMAELIRDVLVERSTRILATVEDAFAHLSGTPDVDAVMAVLDTFAADGRTMYVLTSEYNLYLLRHPELVGEDSRFPVAEKARLEEAVSGIIAEILARMGRRPLFPTGTIASILTTFYLDSFSPSRTIDADAALLRDVVDAVIVAFSEPIDEAGARAPEAEAAGRCADPRCPALGHLGEFVRRRVAEAKTR